MRAFPIILLVMCLNLLLFCVAAPGLAATYYVDAVNGNDSFSGGSATVQGSSGPFQTLAKVNKLDLRPGDSVLFKAGGFWRGGLEITASGAPQAPITLGSYGAGKRPIISVRSPIPGAGSASSWSSFGNNTWAMLSPGFRHRVWFNNVEKFGAESLTDISASTPWFYNEDYDTMYVYSPQNPAQSNLGLEMPYAKGVHEFALQLKGSDNIVVRGLDFRGGAFATVGISGADSVLIEECSIGRDTDQFGLVGHVQWMQTQDNNSEYVKITKCIVDSGLRLKYPFYPMNGADGVSIRTGARYWEVSHSTFRDWYHNGLQLHSSDPNFPSSYNKVFNNRFYAANISYGRGFSTEGKVPGACTHNEITHNIVANTSVRNQVGGDNNLVAYNVIVATHNIRLTDRTYWWGKGQGIVLEIMFGGDGVCQNNKIYNNTIVDTDEAGIWIAGYDDKGAPGALAGNEIVNNIIYNCGLKSYRQGKTFGLMVDSDRSIGANTFKNNVVYSENIQEVISFNYQAMNVNNWNALGGQVSSAISGNMQSNPKFEDMSKSFQLAADSPCLNAGINLLQGADEASPLKTDFAGNSTPQGKGVDIGAYERP